MNNTKLLLDSEDSQFPENNLADASNLIDDLDDNSELPVLLVSSSNSDEILRYNAETGEFLDVFISGGDLDSPGGITIGADSNFYVTSQDTDEILRYDGDTGEFIDVFTSGSAPNFPSGGIFGPNGDLYVTSVLGNQVLRYDGDTGEFIDVFASGSSLDNPTGIAFGPDGNFYVSSSALFNENSVGTEILRYDGKTGEFIDVFATGNGLNSPGGIVFGSDNNLYVSSFGSDEVLRYNGETGEFIDVFVSGGNLDNPGIIAFGPDGNLYVGSTENNAILRYDGKTGEFIDVFASGEGLDNPIGFTFTSTPILPNQDFDVSNNLNSNLEPNLLSEHDPPEKPVPVFDGIENNLLDRDSDNNTKVPDIIVSSSIQDELLRFDGTTGEFVDVFASGNGLDDPGVSIFGPDNNLYVSSRATDEVLRYDGETGEFIDVFASGNGLDSPNGAIFGPDGNFYVNSELSNEVLRYDGETGEFIDVFASGKGLNGPVDLVFGSDGNLYVTSGAFFDETTIGTQVLRFDGTTGEFIDVFASGNGLNSPGVLTFGPDGNLYVNSFGSDEVLRFDGTTGEFIDVFASGSSLDEPTGLGFGLDGNLYVSGRGNDGVLRFDGTTGEFIDVFASGEGLDNPIGLTFTSTSPSESLDKNSSPESELDSEGQIAFEGFPYESNFVELSDGLDMHYLEEGSGDPIVLLHGVPTSSYLWRDVIPELSERGRVIVPDLINFGFSDKTEPLDFVEHGEFLTEFIENLGLEDITFAFHDWGGPVGMSYVVDNPDNVKAIAHAETFVQPFPDLESLAGNVSPLFGRLIQPETSQTDVIDNNLLIEGFLFDPQFEGIAETPTEAEQEVYREPFVEPESREQFLTALQEVPILDTTGHPIYDPDGPGGNPPEPVPNIEEFEAFEDFLSTTDIPQLLIAAEPGRLIPPESIPALQELIPDLEVAQISSEDNPGFHFLQEDLPEEFTSALTDWLDNSVIEEEAESVFGGLETNEFDAANSGDDFDGDRDETFAGAGDDLVDASQAKQGRNHILGGTGLDELLAGKQDIISGGAGEDILDASVGSGGNRLYGGDDNDELFAGTGDRLFAGSGDDLLDATNGQRDNLLYGQDGNDSFFLGAGDRLLGGDGDDAFFVVDGGDNLITGGEGADAFWIASGELITTSNTITDFELDSDVIGVAGIGVTSTEDLGFNQVGNDAVVSFSEFDLATLANTQVSDLQLSDVFVFA